MIENNKKLFIFIILMVLVFTSVQNANAEVANFKIGQQLTIETNYIGNSDKLLLPVRELFSPLGAEIYWESSTKTVVIIYENNNFSLPVNSNYIRINENKIFVNNPTVIDKDRAFIPLEILSKLLRTQITWDKARNTILLTHLNNNYISFSYSENWPIHVIEEDYEKISEIAIQNYKKQNRNYASGLQEYTTKGDYLNYGKRKNYKQSENLIFNEKGIPMIRYGTQYYYNPVTIAQYALSLYGRLVNGEAVYTEFIDAIEKLISLQDERGAFLYDFNWRYYLTGKTYKPGWVSGMAQGQALSALSRAFLVTNDIRYLEAGNRALEYLVTPVEDGGVMDTLKDLNESLEDYIIFEEYLSNPASYTLNGYMFTLLGLYDWSNINQTNTYHQDKARNYFMKGNKTLIGILPYFDIGGFTAYDLGYITHNKKPHIGVGYHAVHIELLHSLFSITNLEHYKYYENLWRSYVD